MQRQELRFFPVDNAYSVSVASFVKLDDLSNTISFFFDKSVKQAAKRLECVVTHTCEKREV